MNSWHKQHILVTKYWFFPYEYKRNIIYVTSGNSYKFKWTTFWGTNWDKFLIFQCSLWGPRHVVKCIQDGSADTAGGRKGEREHGCLLLVFLLTAWDPHLHHACVNGGVVLRVDHYIFLIYITHSASYVTTLPSGALYCSPPTGQRSPVCLRRVFSAVLPLPPGAGRSTKQFETWTNNFAIRMRLIR